MQDEPQFSGGVFSDEIDDGRAGANIELERTGIVAHTMTDQTFSLPYGDCQIEVGGASGRMVFCRNSDRSLTIFCEDRKFPRALDNAALGLLGDQLSSALGKRRSERRRGRFWVAVFGAVCLAALVAGYFGILAGARAAVKAVPLSVDQQIGELAIEQMDLQGTRIRDPKIVQPIEKMVERLAPHAAIDGITFEVRVIDSPVVNAFALPGGQIVVYTGLMEKAKTPEQVAGVIAHEMAHVTLRHGLERVGQSLGIVAAIQFMMGDARGLAAVGAEALQTSAINSYSRGQENDADLEGARMMHAAGLDPLAMAGFFEILQHEHGDVPGAMSWLSTHPQHKERIAAIEAKLKELPDQQFSKLDIDWAEVQRHLDDPEDRETGDAL